MAVLTLKLQTFYSPDELEELIEDTVWNAVKITTGYEVHMLEDVSDHFDSLKGLRKLLGKTQDLLLRDHGIKVWLTILPDDELADLLEGSYVDLSQWIFGKVAADPLEAGELVAPGGPQ